MFSVKRINEKIRSKNLARAPNHKRHNHKLPKDSFLSFASSSSSAISGEKVGSIKQEYSAQRKKKIKNDKDQLGLSWRFFNKLENEEKEIVSKKKDFSHIEEQHCMKVEKSSSHSINLDDSVETSKRKKINKRRQLRNKNFNEKVKNLNSKQNSKNNEDMSSQLSEFYESLAKEYSEPSSSIQNVSSSLVNEDVLITDASNQDESELLPFTENEKKPYLGIKSFKRGTLTIVILPGTKLFIRGYYYLKLIFGSISVLGYSFNENEEHAIFSPPICSFLSIDVSGGYNLKDIGQMGRCDVPSEWLQELDISNDQAVSLIEIRKYESNMCRILDKFKGFIDYSHSRSFNLDLFKAIVGVKLIEHLPSFASQLLIQPQQWNEFLKNELPLKLKKNQRTSIVISGGKDVGKSTFLKVLINTALSSTPCREIACLDLDPGQPEFSLSGCLSLTVLKSPVLGPPFSHWEELEMKLARRVLLGDISVQNVLREYLHIVMSLMDEYNSFNSSVPLIVNTMGFTARTGFDIMVDVLRIVRPSCVITIESSTTDTNYPHALHCDFISNIRRGILDFSPYPILNYDLVTFQSPVRRRGSVKSKDLREINLTSYLSKLWNDTELNLIGETCRTAVQVEWSSIAVHVQSACVPHHRVLQSLNASLVALCKIDNEYLEYMGDNLPLRIHDYRAWFTLNVCLGWGIVSGIDPLTRKIHILTPLDRETVLNEVNVIAVPKLHLPFNFHTRFGIETAPYTEYFRKAR